MLAWALPSRGASSPVTRALCATLTRAASVASSSETSTRSPVPRCSAASTATAAFRPHSTSLTATPTLCGGASAGPVMCMSPLSAWAMKS